MPASYDCWACGSEGSFHVRIDKRGRGYWACGACNHRVFTYTGRAFVMMGELAKAVTKGRDAWKAAVAAQLAATFGAERAASLAWKQLTSADLAAVGVVA